MATTTETATEAPLDPLTRLAIRYGTDKWGQHLYTPCYDRLLSPLRDRPVRLLEIGVGWPTVTLLGGGSLCMWRDYFPFGHIVGLDLQPKRLSLGPRITVLQGSQSDPAYLRRLWAEHGPFDIVIDDGSHRVSDVLTSFETLYPLLPDRGFYAVEDTQTAFWPEFGGNPDGHATIFTRLADLIRGMHAPEITAGGATPPPEPFGALTAAVTVFRNLLVAERGRNDYPSNRAMDLAHPTMQSTLERLAEQHAREPTDGSALVLSGLLDVAGRLPEALAAAQDGLATHPDSIALLCHVQTLATRLGRRDESRAALDRLFALAPDEPIFAQVRQKRDG